MSFSGIQRRITFERSIFITPAGFEDYLEAISPFSPATDMPKILEISSKYGITFHM